MGVEMEIVAQEDSIAKHGNGIDRSVSSIKQELSRALSLASEQEASEYKKLLWEWRELRVDGPECNSFLECRLKALSQMVSYINEREHSELLSYILGMSLWVHSAETSNSLVEFVVNLASVNGGCVAQCLDMLVRNFLPPSCGLPAFVDFFSRRAVAKGMSKETLMQKKVDHMNRKESVLDCVHSALQRISDFVPITSMHLHRIVLQRMPHRIIDKEWNALYMENMLRLEQAAKSEFLKSQMLLAVVDRLIEIDVEIRWEDIVKEDDCNKVFVLDMEFDEALDDNEACVGPGSEAQHAAGISQHSAGGSLTLCAVADKMDVLMDMTLQHLQRCAEAGRIEQVFNILMTSFQSTILDTYKSKFTQFLIFYMCSQSPLTLSEKFTSLLCEILTSSQRAPNTRMSAAAYLASFLARARYVPLCIVSSCLRRMVEWCISYTPRQAEKVSLTVDTGVHGVLYSACQAIMYVLCFKMRGLLDDSVERATLCKLPLNDLLRHSLNPLKLCLPSVVEEFLKQATAAGLVDRSLSTEVNKNISVLVSNSFGGINRLDMFFPFDPYLLRRSDRFIRPSFLFWSMVQSLDDDVSDSDFEGNRAKTETHSSPDVSQKPQQSLDSDSMEDDDSVIEDDEDLDEFEISMNRMSLTPRDYSPVLRKAPVVPLPLPAKLTPEVLQQYSDVFL